MIELLNIDAMEMYHKIEPGTVHLVITDPPYQLDNSPFGKTHAKMSLQKLAYLQGTTPEYNISHISTGWDHEAHMAEWQRLMPKFHAFIFCSNAQVSRLMQWGEEREYITTLLCWNKTNTAPLANGVWRQDAEWIVHIRERGTYFQGTAAEKCKVWQSACQKSEWNHPTQKPEELIAKYMKIGTDTGMIVMDPFSGSGTTAAVCHKLNRSFIGSEINAEYYRRAMERIEDLQTNLIAYHDAAIDSGFDLSKSFGIDDSGRYYNKSTEVTLENTPDGIRQIIKLK